MPDKIEKFGLFEIKDLFMQELARVFSLAEKGKEAYPPTSSNPVALEDWLHAFDQINLQPFSDEAIFSHYKRLLGDDQTPYEKLDPLRISSYFRSGERACLIGLPFDDVGLPIDEEGLKPSEFPRLLRLEQDNLTHGFGSINGYYFDLLPIEIQEQCTFDIPAYANSRMPSKAEIDQLRAIFFPKLNSLANLHKRLSDKRG